MLVLCLHLSTMLAVTQQNIFNKTVLSILIGHSKNKSILEVAICNGFIIGVRNMKFTCHKSIFGHIIKRSPFGHFIGKDWGLDIITNLYIKYRIYIHIYIIHIYTYL